MTKQFIEKQQELARKKYPFSFKNMGIVKAPDVDKIIADTITNTGKELMRRAEGERDSEPPNNFSANPNDWDSTKNVHNQAIDTIKQHITNVTGWSSMTTKNIEDVVAEFDKLLNNKKWGAIEMNYIYTTLTKLAKEAAAEERERMFAIIDAEAIRTPEGDWDDNDYNFALLNIRMAYANPSLGTLD